MYTHTLETEMATHSSILAWRIPGTEEPGGLPSMGSHRGGHDWSDSAAAAAHTYTHTLPFIYPFIHWRTLGLFPELSICVCGCVCVCSVSRLCPTLCDSMDYSPPGSSVHGLSQQEYWSGLPFPPSRGSFRPRDWTRVSCISCIGRWVLYHWATWEAI